MSKFSLITWMHPSELIPPHGLDMSSPHDYLKVEMLYNAFVKDGFDKTHIDLEPFDQGNYIAQDPLEEMRKMMEKARRR